VIRPGERRFSLVLGGGALRGLAHIGALRALEERGWKPEAIVGTSIGALVASTWASGFPVPELEAMALGLRRRDIFQISHADMALKRMMSPALYRKEPLQDLVRGLLGDLTFRELPHRLVITAVEINSGQQIFFGLPGLEDVTVADAVIASCSLPGFFPAHEIDSRFWVDGALVDNLPVRLAASLGVNAVVAVDVGASSVIRADMHQAGFAVAFARASEIVFHQAQESHLRDWKSPALLLVQPRVEHVPMFSFDHTRELMAEGQRATQAALDAAGEKLFSVGSGIWPKRRVQLRVVKERCIGCGVCVASEPGDFHMGPDGRAVARPDPREWSPLDGAVLRHCPTYAIMARPILEAPAAASRAGASTGTVRESA